MYFALFSHLISFGVFPQYDVINQFYGDGIVQFAGKAFTEKTVTETIA